MTDIGMVTLLSGNELPAGSKGLVRLLAPNADLNQAQVLELHTTLGDLLGIPRLTLGVSEEDVIERWNVLTDGTDITYELSREEAVIRLAHALEDIPLITDGTTDLIDEELLEFIRQNRLDPGLEQAA